MTADPRRRLRAGRLLALAGVVLALLAAEPAHADRAGRVRADADRLVAAMLDHCRDDPARTLNTAGLLEPLSDPVVFRAACGRGLHGRPLMGTAYTAFFHRERNATGLFEVFGAAREVAFAGRRYRVVIGQTARAAVRDGAVVDAEIRPSAYAMEFQGDRWRQVWTFLDPVTGDRVLPRGPFTQDPIAPPGADAFLRRLWRDHVTGSFHDLLFTVRDSIGVPLVE
ncbi:hypothetical protein [Roseospira goensis]|uniref:SnoaL-like domain-containing protein n=1 Tax=Roseospira goensis TaxID=391922 RepID=A0A7W6S119_9PROT|nr:hypothetical protein [Roseospira goensis]MBB4286762.1 hypothetical protein [Roseospira goensis]